MVDHLRESQFNLRLGNPWDRHWDYDAKIGYHHWLMIIDPAWCVVAKFNCCGVFVLVMS